MKDEVKFLQIKVYQLLSSEKSKMMKRLRTVLRVVFINLFMNRPKPFQNGRFKRTSAQKSNENEFFSARLKN